MSSTAAPVAPGHLGQAIAPEQLQTYVAALQLWLAARRTELDDLDQAALAAGRTELTTDVMLALSLWEAVSTRTAELTRAWDGGRVGVQERQTMSTLIWGRLEDDHGDPDSAANLAVSLPEACRLSDAMTAQLRSKLALDPQTDANAARVRAARAALERLRDQILLEPLTTRAQAEVHFDGLSRRIEDVLARATRGADVGGLLGPLEVDLARFERDLIVGNAQRRTARDTVRVARKLRADLIERERALAALVAKCVAVVSPAPRLAVPDVTALGAVPNTAAELDAYLTKLKRVDMALTLASAKYTEALADHAELGTRLDGYAAKAVALGVDQHPDVRQAEHAAREVLARRPCPVAVAAQLLATYERWLTWASQTPAESATDTSSDPSKESA